jgi:hypothetical protein
MIGEYKANMLRSSALSVRLQIEAALTDRIPSALTPVHRSVRPVAPTGVRALDELLQGGIPVGAITEMAGPECSGRTALALSFVARNTAEAKVCAWVDTSDSLHPESAAAAGVDLARLLWVRCGVASAGREQATAKMNFVIPEKYLVPPPAKRGLHGGGYGPHPRTEAKGLSDAVGGLLRPELTVDSCAEPQRREPCAPQAFEPSIVQRSKHDGWQGASGKPYARIGQALRVTDLLLQAGGFSAIVLDLGSIAPEYALRVPLATWFRYRAAAERTQASIVLLTQHACAKSSAGLVLRMQGGVPLQDESTVFSGMEHRIEIVRERFAPVLSNVIPLRKPPQSERQASWQSRAVWAGRR